MPRPPKHGTLPVSQKDLAGLLGISPTMMALSQGAGAIRNLRSEASLRLSKMELTHLQVNQKNRNYQPAMPAWKLKELAARAREMESDADWALSKAQQLQRRLEKMQKTYESARQWMNSIEQLLEKLPNNKESKHEKLWLGSQQADTGARLDQNGILPQLRLEMEIQLLTAKATITRNAAKKLGTELSKHK